MYPFIIEIGLIIRMEGYFLKKLHFMLIVSLVMLLLAACGDKNEPKLTEEEFDPNLTVEVDIQIPETAEPNEKIKIQAIVTYGDEKVTDADKVGTSKTDEDPTSASNDTDGEDFIREQ